MKLKAQSVLPGLKATAACKTHGGDLARGRRKTFRPIDPKQALHVVLRSSKARGELSMLHPKHCDYIHDFVQKTARRWGVRVYRFANVGNHLHMLVRVPSRTAWQRFLKELSGGIALIVTGAKKGAALDRSSDASVPESSKRGFWDCLAFTRIVSFGRDFKSVSRYLVKNLFEAAGLPMSKLVARGYRIMIIDKNGDLSGAPSY